VPSNEEEKDYYALFDLSPHMSFSEIRARLNYAARELVTRASSAPEMEQRYEAERKQKHLAEAEAVLLKPASRKAYDERWRNRQSSMRYSIHTPSQGTDQGTREPSRANDMARCPKCGTNNHYQSIYCEQCGEPLATKQKSDQPKFGSSSQEQIPQPVVINPSPPPIVASPSQSNGFGGQDPISSFNSEPLATPNTRVLTTHNSKELIGTIVRETTRIEEPPDFNWAKLGFFSLLSICMLPLVLMAVGIWISLSISLRMVGFRRGSKMFDFGDWFGILSFFGAGRGTNRDRYVPVVRYEVKDQDNKSHAAMLKGHLDTRSAIMNAGDDVTLYGYRDGKSNVFIIKNGINHTLGNSRIIFKDINWKAAFLMLATVLATIITLVAISGMHNH